MSRERRDQVNRRQVEKAMRIYEEGQAGRIDLDLWDRFFSVDRPRIEVPISQAAALIGWQAMQFDGNWSSWMLNDILDAGLRHRCQILDDYTPPEVLARRAREAEFGKPVPSMPLQRQIRQS